MRTRLERKGTVAVVKPQGQLHDIEDAELKKLNAALEILLATPAVTTIIVDLSDLTHTNSSGVGPLAHVHDKLMHEHLDRRLIVVVTPHSHVEQLLKITKLDTVLTIVGTEDEALKKADKTHPSAA